MTRKNIVVVLALIVLELSSAAWADKKKDLPSGSAVIHFAVIKDTNGKPVRNASVILHPVDDRGRQEKGGFQLKTDADGKVSTDGVPYGKVRVQVLATGYQTFGEDFDINEPQHEFTIKLKPPQKQYSIYEDHPEDRPKDHPADGPK